MSFKRFKSSIFGLEEKIIDFISHYDPFINMIPFAIAVGEEYTYFISDDHKFIENERIEGGTLFNSANDSVHPCDYHVLNCEKGACKTMQCNPIHRF